MYYVINVIYDILDIYDISHLTCINISIWVSKEALNLRNAANYLKYPTKLFLVPKT